jgi:hypothetical protein
MIRFVPRHARHSVHCRPLWAPTGDHRRLGRVFTWCMSSRWTSKIPLMRRQVQIEDHQNPVRPLRVGAYGCRVRQRPWETWKPAALESDLVKASAESSLSF